MSARLGDQLGFAVLVLRGAEQRPLQRLGGQAEPPGDLLTALALALEPAHTAPEGNPPYSRYLAKLAPAARLGGV